MAGKWETAGFAHRSPNYGRDGGLSEMIDDTVFILIYNLNCTQLTVGKIDDGNSYMMILLRVSRRLRLGPAL